MADTETVERHIVRIASIDGGHCDLSIRAASREIEQLVELINHKSDGAARAFLTKAAMRQAGLPS
jgi:hypothetical protein